MSPARSVHDPARATARRALAGLGRAWPGVALALVALVLLLASGCTGGQSVLDPAGVGAERIDGLWWLYFWVSAAAYLIVLVFFLVPVFTRREPVSTPPSSPVRLAAEKEGRFASRVTTAVVVVVGVLLVFLVADVATRGAIRNLTTRQALEVQVTARQWWWQFDYLDPQASRIVTTANELHLPVNRTVRFDLRAPDVIHSLWMPNLLGKKDLVPGHPTQVYARPTRTGTFMGQCAEFCGLQHATMRFVVVVEPADRFQGWLDHQRQPAAMPTSTSQQRGQQVFLQASCAMCHSIQGTRAMSGVGPDLTHVGGRLRIASAFLPNTRGHLAGWIVDPQRLRPGVRMPPNPLAPADLRALVDYLESLR